MSCKIEYEDLKFRIISEKDKTFVRAEFIRNYYFDISSDELSDISQFEVVDGSINFECSEKKARNKLSLIIDKGFSNLFHKVRNKKTLYIHRNSGIPLIGTNEFGLVDRGSNIIEVKPLTGCNLSCIFCSVSEGVNDKTDIVVEEEYLVEEFAKLASIKKNPIEANIGPQGEPLLYPKLLELIRDLKSISNVKVISINTNGLTLNPKFIDELVAAGLTRINLSIHTLDKTLASELANGPFNLDHLLKMIKYCEGKVDILLAPVVIPGKNEQELDGIIELSKTIKNKKYPSIGIQNYLNYKSGRNIAEQMSWDSFFDLLKQKEKEHDVKLIITENTFEIYPDETFPKPFKKGQIISVNLKSFGRTTHEALGEASDRCITVLNCSKSSGTIKIKLIRDKHNIFSGIQL
ncbi:molybdenum cofactor biosynthesis protein MoaA [Candidatus Woesearchaeota archaeon CG10_big_fil_rev_8_21_14_0_10_32_9]|nr:MAG: molybdenum cofactor biosynthesis protein MoaA [Candidatus Woesearchaeota archaeon CG10_big_fil_rev_8_21_14_0_10_32_9]